VECDTQIAAASFSSRFWKKSLKRKYPFDLSK